jgi:hypothetical protein
MRTVIALYSKTDAIVRPWLDVGFHAVLVDLQHPAGEHTEGNVTRIGADMLEWVPPLWLAQSTPRFVAAFPPCDHLAVSGARWFAGKGLGKLAHSIGFSSGPRSGASGSVRRTALRTPSAPSAATGASLTTHSTRISSRALSGPTTTPKKPAYGPETALSCRNRP